MLCFGLSCGHVSPLRGLMLLLFSWPHLLTQPLSCLRLQVGFLTVAPLRGCGYTFTVMSLGLLSASNSRVTLGLWTYISHVWATAGDLSDILLVIFHIRFSQERYQLISQWHFLVVFLLVTYVSNYLFFVMIRISRGEIFFSPWFEMWELVLIRV